jgi:hypothetical protein
MERMEEFLRRQREGASVVVAAYNDLTEARAELTDALLRAAKMVAAIPGGQRERERAAAAAVGQLFMDNAMRSREKTKDILAAVAALSKNWSEQQDLWNNLRPEDLSVVSDATASWTDLRRAAVGARDGDRTLQVSLGSFQSLGWDAATVSEDLLVALTGVAAASSELTALADEYLGDR